MAAFESILAAGSSHSHTQGEKAYHSRHRQYTSRRDGRRDGAGVGVVSGHTFCTRPFTRIRRFKISMHACWPSPSVRTLKRAGLNSDHVSPGTCQHLGSLPLRHARRNHSLCSSRAVSSDFDGFVDYLLSTQAKILKVPALLLSPSGTLYGSFLAVWHSDMIAWSPPCIVPGSPLPLL